MKSFQRLSGGSGQRLIDNDYGTTKHLRNSRLSDGKLGGQVDLSLVCETTTDGRLVRTGHLAHNSRKLLKPVLLNELLVVPLETHATTHSLSNASTSNFIAVISLPFIMTLTKDGMR